MTTISKAEIRALAGEVLAHRLAHWGAGPAPKGRVTPIPTEPVGCELAWNHTRRALANGTLVVQ